MARQSGSGPLVAVAARGLLREDRVDVGDRDELDGRQPGAVDTTGGAVAGGVRPAGHAGTDDGDTEGPCRHVWTSIDGP